MSGSWDRERVAAELHDGPVQVVSMVALQLEALTRRGELNEQTIDKTEALAAQLRDAAVDLRRIISELRGSREGKTADD